MNEVTIDLTEFLTIGVQEFEKILEKTDGYCPCVPKNMRNPDNKCKCKEYRENFICKCGYIKKVIKKHAN